MRKKRRSAVRRRRRLTVFLVVLMLLVLGAVTVWKGFVVKKVDVEGNQVYSDEQIENWVLNDEYSWNSFYVFIKNKLRKTEEIPFVDHMEISLKNPQTLCIQVVEKAILGYVYIPSLGENAYFDKDGFVVELSPDVLNDVMKINGLVVEDAVLYEKLKLENSGILQTLLTVTQLLKKYEQSPDTLVIRDGNVLLSFGEIQVNLGDGNDMNEKILRMQQIFPELKGKKGTLHLETWTKNNTDVFFRKNELTAIPNDVREIPRQEKQETKQETN